MTNESPLAWIEKLKQHYHINYYMEFDTPKGDIFYVKVAIPKDQIDPMELRKLFGLEIN
jgi:hypothetical protein